MRFNTLGRVEHHNTAIKDTQTSLNFSGEVDVPRGVDDIHAIAFPFGCHRGGYDRNTPFALLFHPIRYSVAVVNVADTISLPCVKQDSFGRRGFTGINVRDNTKVTVLF